MRWTSCSSEAAAIVRLLLTGSPNAICPGSGLQPTDHLDPHDAPRVRTGGSELLRKLTRTTRSLSGIRLAASAGAESRGRPSIPGIALRLAQIAQTRAPELRPAAGTRSRGQQRAAASLHSAHAAPWTTGHRAALQGLGEAAAIILMTVAQKRHELLASAQIDAILGLCLGPLG